MAEAHYRIGTVARLSGLSTHVIRVWERRYAVLSPDRTPGGARLYDDADVERLRFLKRAVDAGHPIGTLAELSTRELERLTAVGRADGTPSSAPGYFVDEILRAVAEFDEPRAERALASAARLLSPRALVLEVLSPVLQRIGDEWASGELCVASEHFGSMLVRHRLGALLDEHQPAPDARPLLAATPQGELHEFGALLASVIAALRGRRVLYLGPNLPASQIVEAARGSGAKVVLLSIVALDKRAALREARALRRALPDDVSVVLGGASAAAVAASLDPPLASFGTLEELDAWLLGAAEPSGKASRTR